MTPRGLRRLGTGLLLATAAGAAGVAAFALATNSLPPLLAVLLALFVAWPLLSLVCWRKGIPGGAWGLMAVYFLEAWFLGLGWGGLMAYGIVPYAAGNMAWRWLARADREGRA